MGKRVSLSSCFFFGDRSYTDLRDQCLLCIRVIHVSHALLSLFRAESEIFLVFTPYDFPVVSHAGNVYVFCACVTIKKWRREQHLLTGPKKTFNFCDKTVSFNFKIVIFSESYYFHLILILRILLEMSVNVSLMEETKSNTFLSTICV